MILDTRPARTRPWTIDGSIHLDEGDKIRVAGVPSTSKPDPCILVGARYKHEARKEILRPYIPEMLLFDTPGM